MTMQTNLQFTEGKIYKETTAIKEGYASQLNASSTAKGLDTGAVRWELQLSFYKHKIS
jgi:hypothetical protein